MHAKGNDELLSDNTSVILSTSESVLQKQQPPRLTNYKTNWNKFITELEKLINIELPVRNLSQIDQEIEQFVADVQGAAENSAQTGNKIHQVETTYTADITDLIMKKRRA